MRDDWKTIGYFAAIMLLLTPFTGVYGGAGIGPVELLILANNPQGGEHLKDLLVGQILWVTPISLWPTALLYAAVLAAWFGFREKLGQIGFYVLFALVVTQSVQLVGIYLVFTSLIVPALASRHYPKQQRLAVGYAVGGAGYVSGLIASSLFDLPTGAVIVVTLALAFLVATVVRSPMQQQAHGAKAVDVPR